MAGFTVTTTNKRDFDHTISLLGVYGVYFKIEQHHAITLGAKTYPEYLFTIPEDLNKKDYAIYEIAFLDNYKYIYRVEGKYHFYSVIPGG